MSEVLTNMTTKIIDIVLNTGVTFQENEHLWR